MTDPQGPANSADSSQPPVQGQPPATPQPPAYDPNQYAAPPAYDPNQYAAPPAYGAPAPGQTANDPNQYAAYGAPAPGQTAYNPNQPYGYAPPAPAMPAPKKSRKGLIIALIAVVVLIIAGATALLALNSDSDGGTPDAVVSTYLNALVKNDAGGALAVVQNQPPSKDLLTNDILVKQQALAKISNIKVSKGQIAGASAQVRATYNFGTRNVDETYAVAKVGGSWKLTDGTVAIDVSDLGDLPGLQLFGKDVTGKGKVFVFPGPLSWGSSNADFVIENKNKDSWSTAPDASPGYFTLYADLSTAGGTKLATALKAYLDPCVAAKSTEPKGCPQSVYDFEAVDGTATWTLDPKSVAALKYIVPTSNPSKVQISGQLSFSVTYQAKDFDNKVTNENDTDEPYLSGTVDFSANPPKFTAD